MKVDVLTIEEATFRRFRYWSNWVDVAIYDYNSTPFLLQMRVARSGRKQFNNVRISGRLFYRQTTASAVGDLTQMKREAK